MNVSLKTEPKVRKEMNFKRLAVIATALSVILAAAIYIFINFSNVTYTFGASTKTWTGASNTSWTNSGNWSGGVPRATDNAIIPGDLSNYPVITKPQRLSRLSINSSDENARVTVASGGYLTTTNKIIIYKKGSLIQTGGTISAWGIDCYGDLMQSGGTLLSNNDLKIIKDAEMLQSAGTIHLNSRITATPSEEIEISEGALVTQTGGTINSKDFSIIDGKFIQNENTGTSLVTIGRNFKNEKDFISTAGTIKWTGVSASTTTGSDFKSGKNEFFNVVIEGTENPGFDQRAETKISVAGNWTNNNPNTSVDNELEMIFDGKSNSQTIGGTNPTTFYELKTENEFETLPQFVLDNDIRIENKLDLKKGIISIGQYDITMDGDAEMQGGGKEAYAYTNDDGVFIWEDCAAGDKRLFPVGCELHEKGYACVEIEFNSGHTTDDFSVGAANTVTVNGTRTGTPDTASVVKITWFISEATPGGSNLDFDFEWNDTLESKKMDKNNPLYLRHHTGSYWEKPSGKNGMVRGSGPYKCKIEGYTGNFSPFGVGGEELESPESQYCWATSDTRNDIVKFALTTGLPLLDTISLGISNVEASTLNLAGDTLFVLDEDDIYYVAVNDANPSAIKITSNGIDDAGMTGAQGSKNQSDYDAMSVDMNGNLWAISQGSDALMVVISQVTGKVVPDFFGSGIDYMQVKHPSGLSVDCMAFDPVTNNLFVTLNDGSGSVGSDFLYEVDQTNGDTTLIAAFDVGDIEGMGFDAIGRLLITTGASSLPSSDRNQMWLVDIQDATIYNLGATPGDDTETCDCAIGDPPMAVEISGYVYHDLDNDTTFAVSDSAATSFDVSLYQDMNLNGLYESGTDTLIETGATNSNGFYYFRMSFDSDAPNYIIKVENSDLPTGYQWTTDIYEVATFTGGQQNDEENNFGMYDPTALPVEWLTFEATPTMETVQLNWSTASEVNNDYFSVEFSSDGKSFEEVGMVSGNGTTQSISNFDFEHLNPLTGVNYYRLKQVDFDGEYDYSEIRIAEFGKKGIKLSVYPNPASDIINITGLENNTMGTTISIIDVKGAVVMEKTQPAGLNQTEISLDISTLPRGIYFMGVSGGLQVEAIRFKVQR